LDGGDVSNKWRRWWGAKKNGTDPKVLDAKDKKVIVIGGRALRFICMAITPMSWDITPFLLGFFTPIWIPSNFHENNVGEMTMVGLYTWILMTSHGIWMLTSRTWDRTKKW